MTLLLLLACKRTHPGTDDPPPATGGCPIHEAVSVEVVDGGDPLLLVFDVAVDGAHRRAWATALASRTLGVVDLDAGEVLDRVRLGDASPERPRVAVDGLGDAWYVTYPEPAFYRIDGETYQVTTPLPELSRAAVVLGDPAGGAWVYGEAGPVGIFAHVDASGVVDLQRDDAERLGDLVRSASGDLVGLVAGDSGVDIVRFDPATLQETDRLPSGGAGDFILELEGGDFLLTDETRITLVPADGSTPTVRDEGRDNREMVAWDGGALVLDRQGDESSEGANFGELRAYDGALQVTDEGFATGKHTGYGGLDATTGLVWANSEGTTSVVGLDPEARTVTGDVRVNLVLESLLADPAQSGRAFVTGRLSGTVGTLDYCTGELEEVPRTVTWPVSPTLLGDTLYVLDQLGTTIQRFDAATMEDLGAVDPGLGDNDLLVFDHLVADPARGTLWLVHAQLNVLVEVDPADGSVRGRWDLAADRELSDLDIGRVQLVLVGGLVVVVRPMDGAVTVVDPDQAEVAGSTILDADTVSRWDPDVLDLLWVSDDGATLWIGPVALDIATLTLAPELDVEGTAVIGTDETGIFAWSYPDAVVRHTTAAGATDWEAAVEVSSGGDLSFRRVEAWGGAILWHDVQAGVVHAIPGG